MTALHDGCNSTGSSLWSPTAPHDDLSFEELSARYNYGLTSDRRGVLVRLLLKELARRQRPRRALDIGCGTGIGEDVVKGAEYLRAIREQVDELWGLEPDTRIQPAHGLLDHFQHTTLEQADLPPQSIDVAYSYFVMEHVTEPERFFKALYRCLKPGGVYLFMTPNARHYFTRMAKLTMALRLDEWVLRLLRGKSVEEYHYPVAYQCNDERRITELCRTAGLEPPQFAYVEREGPRPYFPGPLRPIYWMLCQKRRWWRSSKLLLEMICRVVKPAG
jgi:SAM-dependent methyltransferase